MFMVAALIPGVGELFGIGDTRAVLFVLIAWRYSRRQKWVRDLPHGRRALDRPVPVRMVL
jgi:hypothetical protein